jgi:hypothetical protein
MLSQIDGNNCFFRYFRDRLNGQEKGGTIWNLELILISLGYAHLIEWKQYLLIE